MMGHRAVAAVAAAVAAVVAVAVVVVVVVVVAPVVVRRSAVLPILSNRLVCEGKKQRQATERMSEIPHYEESTSRRVK